MVTELPNSGRMEGQGKSIIAPLFQSGAIITMQGFMILGIIGTGKDTLVFYST